MARHGENIYKRKDGRYEGRYVIGRTPAGRTRFGYVYGYQYSDVRNSLLLKKAASVRRATCLSDSASILLSEWLTDWMENEVLGSVKSTTCHRYWSLIHRHILPTLGGMRLDSITPVIAQEFVSGLEKAGLAYNTIKGIYRLFSAAMRYALDEGIIRKNPCRRIRIQRVETKEQRVLSRKEQEKCRAAACGRVELPFLLSLYTGIRLGEICALKWKDIDWERRTITVRRTAQRVSRAGAMPSDKKTLLMIGLPKSIGSCRTLPVPDFLLEQLHRFQTGAAPDAYIFGTASKAAEPRTLQRRFKRFAEKLGIANAHFHTLRHSFATRLLELGVDIKTVSVLLGHSSAKITLDFYAHSMLDRQRAAVGLLASI